MAMSAAASGAKSGRRRRGGPQTCADGRHQHDAVHRRHAGAADHLHGGCALLTVGVPVDLPQTRSAALNVDKQPLIVSVRADGKVYLMETPITVDELVPKLQAIAKTGQDERIFVRGDRTIAYGLVAEVMATITAAGYRKVALVTEVDQKK